MYVAHTMLCFIIGVLELMMDLNTAYLKSHTTAIDLGGGGVGAQLSEPHCASLSWKGLVPAGPSCPKAQFEWAILPRDPLAEVGHGPE